MRSSKIVEDNKPNENRKKHVKWVMNCQNCNSAKMVFFGFFAFSGSAEFVFSAVFLLLGILVSFYVSYSKLNGTSPMYLNTLYADCFCFD